MPGFTLELITEVNYWAVIVSGLVAFTLGGLWYSPVMFEGVWLASNGYSQAQIQATMASLVPFGFAGAILAYTVMALVFALLGLALGVNTVLGGMLLGLLFWLGFVAPSGLTVTLFSPRPLSGWLIDAGFQFTALLTVGAIVGAWR